MCGIVGFTGNNEAAPILLDGLSKLGGAGGCDYYRQQEQTEPGEDRKGQR